MITITKGQAMALWMLAIEYNGKVLQVEESTMGDHLVAIVGDDITVARPSYRLPKQGGHLEISPPPPSASIEETAPEAESEPENEV